MGSETAPFQVGDRVRMKRGRQAGTVLECRYRDRGRGIDWYVNVEFDPTAAAGYWVQEIFADSLERVPPPGHDWPWWLPRWLR